MTEPGGQAKFAKLAAYTDKVRAAVAPGADETLAGPVRLYLSLADGGMHGRLRLHCDG